MFEPIPYVTKAQYMGYCESRTADENISAVRAGNPIRPGMTLDAIYPIKESKVIDGQVTVIEISENGKLTDIARPDRICNITFDKPLGKDALLRMRMIQ
jgi:hypothetical protein